MSNPAFEAALASRYTLEGVLGQGGMSTVYRATDLARSRPVALKVLRPELSAALGAERFQREIAVTARLDHPNIVPLFDSGEAAGSLFFAMPFVEGESLADKLARDGAMPLPDALRITREVAEALQYAHDRGIIHRDIKPANILLSAGHARVADFGIARALTESSADKLTGTGFALGTPHYMSPEQSAGGEVDARSDVYSLASVLYEMLAGEPPYTGPTAQAVIAKRLKNPVPQLSAVREAVSVALEAAVSRGLAKDPADRFATAAAFGEALEQAFAPSAATREASGKPSSRRIMIGVAALAAVAVVAAGSWLLRSRPPESSALARIAIFPFDNHPPDSTRLYLANGLYDALTAELSQLGSVEVIARGSVAQMVSGGKSDREIGAALNANALIKGIANWGGDSLRLTIEFVDPRRETQASRVYSATTGAAMSLPSQATRWIAGRLGRANPDSTRAPYAPDSVALEAYLKARFYSFRGTPADLALSDEYLAQSLRADSAYAPAHALLALQQIIQMFRGQSPPHVAFDRAKSAARRAIALDERLPEAHYQLAYVLALYDWDWAGADREFQRAVELNPSDATALAYYGFFQSWMNRPEEALRLAQRAAALDPVSVLAVVNEATVAIFARRFDLAIAKAQEAIALSPDYVLAHERLGFAHEAKGEHADAIAAYRKALSLLPADAVRQANLASALAKSGRADTARVILDALLARERKEYVPPLAMAQIYAALGQPDDAVQWLERSFAGRQPEMVALQVSPAWDALRQHPGFQALVTRLRFP